MPTRRREYNPHKNVREKHPELFKLIKAREKKGAASKTSDARDKILIKVFAELKFSTAKQKSLRKYWHSVETILRAVNKNKIRLTAAKRLFFELENLMHRDPHVAGEELKLFKKKMNEHYPGFFKRPFSSY